MLTTSKFNVDLFEAKYGSWTYWAGLSHAFPLHIYENPLSSDGEDVPTLQLSGLQIGIIWNGIESIRELEKYSAPILILLSGALLTWAYIKAGGFGPMLSAPSQFGPGGHKAGQFWPTFFPALTANVGFWATLSLNIPGKA